MSDESRAVQIKVSGMHCRSCSMLVDMTLGEIEGVQSATTDLANEVSTVTIDPNTVSVEDLVAAIRSVGYEADPVG